MFPALTTETALGLFQCCFSQCLFTQDINEVALRYPGWLGALARNQMGGAPSSSEKLHVLLELGLDPDTEDLLLEAWIRPHTGRALCLGTPLRLGQDH